MRIAETYAWPDTFLNGPVTNFFHASCGNTPWVQNADTEIAPGQACEICYTYRRFTYD